MRPDPSFVPLRARRALAAGSAMPNRWGACAALAVLGFVIASVLLALGCSPKKHPLTPNLPPDTRVFLNGPIDTVSHRVHIYWFGSDIDGDVVAYRMRFVYPPPGNQNPPWDTLFCGRGRSCTDSLFTMFTGDSATITPRFEIAAIDNEGEIDQTPAVQTFLLSNIAPTIQITTLIRSVDSTYASITVSWDVNDPDGGGPSLHYRVWLDGNEANYDSTSDNTFTVPTSRFLNNGTFQSGPRTLFVQGVDDGGRVGPPTSATWYVRAPAAVLDAQNHGRVLVIDDIPSGGPNNSTYDAFYQGALSPLPAGTFSVLRTQFNPNMFRSSRDFAQTLRLFDAVLWYRGQETTVSSLLSSYQDSLWAYVEAGGKVYLDGLYLIQGLNTPGTMREEATSFLGASGLLLNFSTTFQDSSAGWSNTTTTALRSSLYSDNLRTLIGLPNISNSTGGIRVFAVSDTNDVALWAMDSQLSPANEGFEAPVGMVHDLGAGRIVLISMPLRACAPAPAGRVLNKILFGPTRSLLGP